LKRAINIRNRQRTSLGELLRHADSTLLFFDHAAEKWGAKWPEQLAAHLKKLLETKGISWLEAPARRPGRPRRGRV
jgi:hypothetical protein